MRFLVALSVLGCALAAPFLQDTPEVVAERLRFTQLWNAQAAAAAAAPDDPIATTRSQSPASFSAQPFHTDTGRWTGPVAATVPAGVDGNLTPVEDTADVMAARNAFLAAFRSQVAATTGQQFVAAPQTFAAPQHTFASSGASINALPAATLKWTGPVAATVPAGVNGHIIPVGNTAEVAAATRSFEAAYNAALAATQPQTLAAPQTFAIRSFAPVASPAAQARWTGPVAATIPAGLPGSSSQVGQTADWAAAAAAFQQAYNQAVADTTGRRF